MTDHSSSTAQSPCPSLAPDLPEIGSDRYAPALTLNPDDYLHFLADSDWTESQKQEFIEALWSIVISFVDMGFHIHPSQQVKARAQTLELESAVMLDSQSISEKNNAIIAAGAKATARKEKDS